MSYKKYLINFIVFLVITALKFYFFPPENLEQNCENGDLNSCYRAINYAPFNAFENEQIRLQNACANYFDERACEFAKFITKPSARDDIEKLRAFCDENFALACYFLTQKTKETQIREHNCYYNKFALSCKEIAKEFAEKEEFHKVIKPLKIACESYDAQSCQNLGRMYNHGIGTAEDKKKALILARIINLLKEKK